MTDGFDRFVAIDWSGARGAWQRGIAVAACGPGDDAPALVAPPGRSWSRAGVLAWLAALAGRGERALIGLDLSPGFPFADAGAYFPGWADSPADMAGLWALVDRLCAADPDLAACSFVADPEAGRHFRRVGALGDRFPGGRGRLRACERAQRAMRLSPSSCLNLVGAAQVGKASLTGMRVLHRLRGRVPLWPLDPLPAAGPVLVEIYTSLAARAAGLPTGRAKMRDAAALDRALAALGVRPHAALARYDDHATDAVLAAAWLRGVAGDEGLWSPADLSPETARTEGWTFGVR